jgi:CelD/BcsL family acetyltransferase involved in cellulose biosynthesis
VSLTARPWRGLAAFASLRETWDRLAREAGLDPLCNAHAWTLAHGRCFVPEAAAETEVHGWAFELGGETVGLVALRREAARGVLRLARARFLADGTFDSDYLEPPIRSGHEAAVARLFVEAARAEPGLEALVLAGIPAGSRFLPALRAELERRALPRREHDVPCLAAPLPGSFEGYLAGLRPRMRSKVRSAVRAAGERGARVEWCERPAELPAWLEELYRLHGLRWSAAGRPGAFADPRRCRFYAQVALDALERGELCFARLVEGGTTRAAQIGVRRGERYYQLQEGYDPASEEQRVGVALRALALAALIERGVRAYDFMAGDSQHKRDWGAEPRACRTIAFPLPKWRARLAYGLRARVERWFPRADRDASAAGR